MAIKEIFTFISSDYQRYKGSLGEVKNVVTYLLFGFDHRFNYCFWLRLASQKNLLFPLAIWMHRRLSKKYILKDEIIKNQMLLNQVLKNLNDQIKGNSNGNN